MTNVTAISNALPSTNRLAYSVSTDSRAPTTADQTECQSLKAQQKGGVEPNCKLSTSLALHKPTSSPFQLTGQMVLSYLYGNPMPANNILDGVLNARYSREQYKELSARFISVGKEVGLQTRSKDSFLAGDGIAVEIPISEQGGRMLARALHRFDQVDDITGGNRGGVQQSIVPLLRSERLDKNKAFMHGLADEVKKLQLPWYLQVMVGAQTVVDLASIKGNLSSRGFMPPSNTRGNIVRINPVAAKSGAGKPSINVSPYRAPPVPNKPAPSPTVTRGSPPTLGGTSPSLSNTSASGNSKVRTTASASTTQMTTAMRILVVSSNSRSIENPKRFEVYLDNLNGLPLSTVKRIGLTSVALDENSLSARSRSYRNVASEQLVRDHQVPLIDVDMHNAHLIFGTPSKLGEAHATSPAFRLFSVVPWAKRGFLPGQGGTKTSEFWRTDQPKDFRVVNTAFEALETADFNTNGSTFRKNVVKPLMEIGVLPKGSPLATRLERLESSIAKRDELLRQVGKSNPSPTTKLVAELNSANVSIKAALKQIASQSFQTRSEMIVESLGTPKTTYELTVRHAAGARYMQSVEGQTNPVFNAIKFRQILTTVKAEAGPESVVSLKWHREFVKIYSKDSDFNEAMQQSPKMLEAWSAYKAKYGI